MVVSAAAASERHLVIPPSKAVLFVARIVYFPATGTRGEAAPVTRTAVFKTDESRTFDERLGGYRNQFRLNIDPWDLQRIVAEANRLGREGVEVVGFGYDYDSQAVVLGPKRAG